MTPPLGGCLTLPRSHAGVRPPTLKSPPGGPVGSLAAHRRCGGGPATPRLRLIVVRHPRRRDFPGVEVLCHIALVQLILSIRSVPGVAGLLSQPVFWAILMWHYQSLSQSESVCRRQRKAVSATGTSKQAQERARLPNPLRTACSPAVLGPTLVAIARVTHRRWHCCLKDFP